MAESNLDTDAVGVGAENATAEEEQQGVPTVPVPVVPSAPMQGRTLDVRDYKRMSAQCEELRRINTGLESEKLRHESLIADLEERGRRDEQFIAVLEEERSRFRAEIDSLKRDRAEWASQLWVLKKTYTDYTQTIEAYERCCENQAAEIAELKKQIVKLGGVVEEEYVEIELPSQPTEPIPDLSLLGDWAPPEEAPAEEKDGSATDETPSQPAEPSEQKPQEAKPEDDEPLDLTDSKRLHEALEGSAFFDDENQPSFSMPKGRISASLSH